MNERTIRNRTKLIRSRIAEKNIDCLVVTKPANVTYLTAFSGDDSWAVVDRSGVYLVTDSRYIEQARKECVLCRIIERTKPIAQATAKLLNRLHRVQAPAIEKSTPIAVFEVLRKNTGARLRTCEDVIEQLRSVKDGEEVAAIKAAASIAARALHRTLRLITPGITENELAGLLNLEMRRLDATEGFEAIIAFGPNASRPHHQPSSRRLRKRDSVLIDFGAKHKGYCCDITRSFAFGGEISRPGSRRATFYKRVFEVVQEAQAAAIKIVTAGVKMVDVDSAAREVIRKSGLPVYGHGTGHGFGLEIHELPFINEQNKGELKAGQVITIEPGVYMPGRVGVRLEDDVLVSETGCEILTGKCPHSLTLSGFEK
jgi:Xaa-Pro aminopeptidase